MSILVILSIHAMNTFLAHPLVLRDMLTGKTTILAQNNPNAQAQHRQTNQYDYDQNTHYTAQSYKKKMTCPNKLHFFYKKICARLRI